jgi:hypothetical protein
MKVNVLGHDCMTKMQPARALLVLILDCVNPALIFDESIS